MEFYDGGGSATGIRRYHKKPVVIEAVRWLGDLAEISAFLGPKQPMTVRGDAIAASVRQDSWGVDDESGALWIATQEGVMKADLGDWIIKGVKGEFDPCKPDIFAATHEPVDGR